MIIGNPVKDPAETLRVRVDCAYWLAGTTIVLATAVITPLNPAIPLEATLALGLTATELDIYLSGGEAGVEYVVELTIQTADGQARFDTLLVRCKEFE
jgi:hypothetical protein